MELFDTENEFIEWLRVKALNRDHRVKAGIGDDAAVLAFKPGYEVLLKSDMSIEGVHFKTSLHPPRSVGHRALARSLSDIAAMGGTPKFALVAITLSTRPNHSWLKSFYHGLFALATRCGVAVVGGDTAVVTEGTMVDLVVAGEVEPGRALLRSGARPGDAIYVSGWPGASALGLRLLMGRPRLSRGFLIPPSGRTTASAPFHPRHALQAHLYPEPRLALGRHLLKRRLASAAMDVSDGISTDLGRLAEASAVGVVVQQDLLPKPANLPFRETDWLELALHGGEDYELLFTVSRRRVPLVPRTFQGVPLHRIGEITKSRALRLVGPDGKERELEPGGYDHFRKA